MNEDDIRWEICSVFVKPMKNDLNFPFTFLQCSGGVAKVLVRASVSSSWIWTPQEVANLAGQGAIYVLADRVY